MTDERTGLTADNIDGPLAQSEPQRLHLADQHRRLPVECDRRAGPRADLQVRVQSAHRPDPADPVHDGPSRAERHVLQLVRRSHRCRADHLADRRQHRLPVPVQRRQWLAGSGSDGGAERRPGQCAAGRPTLGPDELRRLLQPRCASGSAGRIAPRRLLGRRQAGERNDRGRGQLPGRRSKAGPDVWYTGFHYDTTVSETRIASYIAIARGQVPAKHYFGTWRTFPDKGCDWSWQEQRPVGVDPELPRCRRLRGRLHLPGNADRARLGRVHVRVPDAGDVRPGGTVGAAILGHQPPVDRAGAA